MTITLDHRQSSGSSEQMGTVCEIAQNPHPLTGTDSSYEIEVRQRVSLEEQLADFDEGLLDIAEGRVTDFDDQQFID